MPATGPHSSPVRKTREGTKQAQLIAMLQRPEGATVAQVVEATGWQAHTVRGALAGALKKRLGLAVTSEKTDGGCWLPERMKRARPCRLLGDDAGQPEFCAGERER